VVDAPGDGECEDGDRPDPDEGRVDSLVDGVDYVYTVGMDATAVDERLRAAATGVLALADGGRAYAVPVSIHLVDGRVYLRLSDESGVGDAETSRKLAFVDATDEAALVCYAADGDDSWSVLVTGPIEPVDAVDDVDAASINEAFGPLRVFDETIEDVRLHLYELRPTSVTGRRTTGG
jgi:hypothetical protein